MSKKIKIGLSVREIERLEKEVQEHKKWLQNRSKMLLERLAQLGATNVSLRFSRAVYSGKKDFSVSVKPFKNGYKVIVDGESVLFIEFGSGITYGSGHPEASKHGMGPGTYPYGKSKKNSKTGEIIPNWRNPDGWYIPKEKGGGHTYGNPPAMAVYQTVKDLERELPNIVKEVFR